MPPKAKTPSRGQQGARLIASAPAPTATTSPKPGMQPVTQPQITQSEPSHKAIASSSQPSKPLSAAASSQQPVSRAPAPAHKSKTGLGSKSAPAVYQYPRQTTDLNPEEHRKAMRLERQREKRYECKWKALIVFLVFVIAPPVVGIALFSTIWLPHPAELKSLLDIAFAVYANLDQSTLDTLIKPFFDTMILSLDA